MRVRWGFVLTALVLLTHDCVGLRIPSSVSRFTFQSELSSVLGGGGGGGGNVGSLKDLQVRRMGEYLRLAGAAASVPLFIRSSGAMAATDSMKKMDLSRRIKEVDSVSYEPGLEARDVFYPDWFSGLWQANSTGLGVWAPLGLEAFGGQTTYNAALKDVNTSLVYACRFGPDSLGGGVVADRLFNVESIARAAMGADCVIPENKQPDSDLARRLHLVLSPKVGYDIYDIDLYPTDRLSLERPGGFQVMERTAQIISTRMEQLKAVPAKPYRKDIETIALYTRQSDGLIECLQRTATFLTRVDSRYESAVARVPAVATRAIDVRLYRIFYTRI